MKLRRLIYLKSKRWKLYAFMSIILLLLAMCSYAQDGNAGIEEASRSKSLERSPGF
jgi:hypothetical protein